MKPLRKCILLFGIPRHLSKLLLKWDALRNKIKGIMKRNGDNMLGSKQEHLCGVMHEVSSRVISRGQHRFPGCPWLLVLIIHLPLLPVGACQPRAQCQKKCQSKELQPKGFKKIIVIKRKIKLRSRIWVIHLCHSAHGTARFWLREFWPAQSLRSWVTAASWKRCPKTGSGTSLWATTKAWISLEVLVQQLKWGWILMRGKKAATSFKKILKLYRYYMYVYRSHMGIRRIIPPPFSSYCLLPPPLY